jgi:hypothetical protein
MGARLDRAGGRRSGLGGEADPMMLPRGSRLSLAIMTALLILLQFYVRPRLWDTRFAPDFLLILLLVIAMVSRPGVAAIAGLVVGLLSDALTPVNIGAGMLAHALVGYLAAWSRVVFFGENYLVHLGLLLGPQCAGGTAGRPGTGRGTVRGTHRRVAAGADDRDCRGGRRLRRARVDGRPARGIA